MILHADPRILGVGRSTVPSHLVRVRVRRARNDVAEFVLVIFADDRDLRGGEPVHAVAGREQKLVVARHRALEIDGPRRAVVVGVAVYGRTRETVRGGMPFAARGHVSHLDPSAAELILGRRERRRREQHRERHRKGDRAGSSPAHRVEPGGCGRPTVAVPTSRFRPRASFTSWVGPFSARPAVGSPPARRFETSVDLATSLSTSHPRQRRPFGIRVSLARAGRLALPGLRPADAQSPPGRAKCASGFERARSRRDFAGGARSGRSLGASPPREGRSTRRNSRERARADRARRGPLTSAFNGTGAKKRSSRSVP